MLTLNINPTTPACGSTDLSRGAEVAGFLERLAAEMRQEGYLAALENDDADGTVPVQDSTGTPMGTAFVTP